MNQSKDEEIALLKTENKFLHALLDGNTQQALKIIFPNDKAEEIQDRMIKEIEESKIKLND